jgi:DNA-binding beta-propeller fold protein YncE
MEGGGMTEENERHGGGVRPRTLVIAVVLVLAVAAAYVAFLLLSPQPEVAEVSEVPPPEPADATSRMTDTIPLVDEPPLENPLGIDVDGDVIYVAEADAGQVRVFGLDGEDMGAVPVPVAEGGAGVAYPVDVAVVGEDRLAVVDTAAERVVLLPLEPPASAGSAGEERSDEDASEGSGPGIDTATEATVVGAEEEDTAPGQPTAVAAFEGELFVADAAARLIRRYDTEGRYISDLGEGLEPPLSFVGALFASEDTLWVADSNGGRVLMLSPKNGELVGILQKQMRLPRGVTADLAADAVFVTDRFEGTIEIFDLAGASEGAIREDPSSAPSAADEALRIVSPEDIALDAEGRLYVSDAGSGRVLVLAVNEGATTRESRSREMERSGASDRVAVAPPERSTSLVRGAIVNPTECRSKP